MFNPVKSSQRIKEEFQSYIETSFKFAESELKERFSEELRKIIAKGPYLEINGIFKTGHSMADLIEEGVLSKSWRELEAQAKHPILPLDRELYLHQEKAIRHIVSGRNAIVSTGTGSGKTNCFLIPLLDSLLKEKENGTLGPGVRAILVYPMNALANDQISNIRKILMDYSSITFGVYSGDTEEKEKDAEPKYHKSHADEKEARLRTPLDNELISREHMRANPPNILLTNYVMLEHLLLRPGDDVLFSGSNLRFVVLDEAHVYNGARGIETSFLLRRLKARISNESNVQFILTSATLGKGERSNDGIIRFAQNISGALFSSQDIIRGEREDILSSSKMGELPSDLIRELADESKSVKDILKRRGIPYDDSSSGEELIYDLVSDSSLFHRFEEIGLHADCVPFKSVEDALDIDEDTAVSFVALCARANKYGKSLIDVRYHFWVRALDGAYISPQSNSLYLERRDKDDEGYACFETAICDDCGHKVFVGEPKKEDDGRAYFREISKKRPQKGNKQKAMYLREATQDDDEDDTLARYTLCYKCGAIKMKKRGAKRIAPCDCGPIYHHEMVLERETDAEKHKCGRCGGNYKTFRLGGDAATAVLATSLYEELPSSAFEEDEETTEEKTSSFGFFGLSSAGKIKKSTPSAKQFLVFSDSRQQAARFAPYLTDMYAEFLRRRGLCQTAMRDGRFDIAGFVDVASDLFDTARTFRKSNDDKDGNLTRDSRKQAWIGTLNEMCRFSRPNSLVSLGKIRFHFKPNDEYAERLILRANRQDIDKQSLVDALDALIFEIVKTGSVALPPGTNVELGDDDREYVFYAPKQQYLTLDCQDPDDKRSNIHSWLPKTKSPEAGTYYQSNKLVIAERICRMLGHSNATGFLSDYFELLRSNEERCLLNPDGDGKKYVLDVGSFEIQTPRYHEAHWYKCDKCGAISQYCIDGHCAEWKCDGRLSPVKDPSSLSRGDHFAELYEKESLGPLFIKEHTGQLSREHGFDYQMEFAKKRINALSCSTTFEMGVDIGDLETVFLRDVPPLPANYAQRAGRAGRSKNAAAYCLTYAKLGPHDFTYYKRPEKMISGTVEPPQFKLENEKIAARHIYAVALSMFFKAHPSLFANNVSRPFLEEGGYKEFVKWLSEKPKELAALLIKSIPGDDSFHHELGLDDFSWVTGLIGENGRLASGLKSYLETVGQYEKVLEQQRKSKDDKSIGVTSKGLDTYRDVKLIDFLAKGNVLPRYGFPVDSVELETSEGQRLSLTRGLSIAIGEYAPSSQVVADGKMYTSRYIKRHYGMHEGKPERDFHHSRYVECPECKHINWSEAPIGEEGFKCISCGHVLHKADFYECIEPQDGFIAELGSKDVPTGKNASIRMGRQAIEYIGDIDEKMVGTASFEIGSHEIKVSSTQNDAFLILSRTPFYVCPRCGYSLSQDEVAKVSSYGGKKWISATDPDFPKAHLHHLAPWMSKIECGHETFERYYLCHVIRSDAAIIDFADIDTGDESQMRSVLYAILNAMSERLCADMSDIGGCLFYKDNGYRIVIMDLAPGGIGHSRQLADQDVLSDVLRLAAQNMRNCGCDKSCYGCLRSYDNQEYHDELDRHEALKILKQFI